MKGYVNLHEQLSYVLQTKVEICSADMGRRMIRERLYGKKVFIVLDDMNEYRTL